MSVRNLLVASAICLAVALPAQAKRCEFVPEEAGPEYKKLLDIRVEKEKKAQAGSKELVGFIEGTFKTEAEKLIQLKKDLDTVKEQKPAADQSTWWNPFDSDRSQQNQIDLSRWETKKLEAEKAVDDQKKKVQEVCDELGNPFGGPFQNNHSLLTEIVRKFLEPSGERGKAPGDLFADLIDKVKKDVEEGKEGGLLKRIAEDIKAAKEARDKEIAFLEDCPFAYSAYVEMARNEPAASPSPGASPNASPSPGQTADMGDYTGEGDGPNGTGASPGAPSPAAPASPAAPQTATVTIQSGDTLSQIATQLAPQLGNPPLWGPNGLVSALFRNIQGESSGDPNLIFAGQTIDLEAVKKDLAG